MSQQQRQRPTVRRTNVQEVDSQAIDLSAKLGNRVEPRLDPPPVIAGAPVLAELPDTRERYPLRPISDRLALRPTRPRQTVGQVLKLRLSNLDTEGSDLS